jgi:hypothetical protein
MAGLRTGRAVRHTVAVTEPHPAFDGGPTADIGRGLYWRLEKAALPG